MKLRGVLLVGIFLLFVLPTVNANIVIDEDFDSKYSVGDLIELEFSVYDSNVVSGFVDSYINCGSDEELIDKRYVFLDDEKKNFTTEFLLEEDGECQFEIEFLNNREVSSEFKVGSNIEIDYVINGKNYLPGEEIIIDGMIKKFNNDKYTGVLDFSIDGIVEKAYSVESGNFSIIYTTKEDAEPKDYVLTLSVVEKNRNENEINSGKVTENINILTKPTSINIYAVESFSPPYDLNFEVELLNQVGEEIEGESIIVKVLNFENNVLFEREFNSSNESVFSFPSDSKKGTVYLNAYYGSIFSSIPIYIEDNREIEMEFLDNAVKIVNIGNVIYEGSVKLEINNGENTEDILINVTIDIGESHLHNLPHVGVYNITSGDNKFSGVRLTGAAIMVDGEFNFRSLFVIVLFISFLVFMYVFTRKKKVSNFFNNNKEYGTVEIEKKIETDIARRKMIMKNPSPEKEQGKQNVYMVFLKTEMGIDIYKEIITKYSFKINMVNSKLGYIVFYGTQNSTQDSRLLSLSKILRKFSDMKNDDLSIVLNKGFFEKKITLLKKFASINRELVDMYKGKTIVGNRLMKKLSIQSRKKEEVVEVLGYKTKVWII